MASNSVITSSEALRVLRKDLTQLSDTLHNICQEMERDMSQLGETWRDRKYQEFVQGYQPQIKKCENIAVHYKQWCIENLDPAIERSIALEEANVGGVAF